LSWSEFGNRHRIIGSANYTHDWNTSHSTNIGVFVEVAEGNRYTYNGGNRYSFTYAGDVNGDGNSNDLIYIPKDENDIVLDPSSNWSDLDAFIEQDSYLSEHRGEYAERNGARNPFSSVVDLKFIQDIFVDAGGRKHTLQLTFDIFNLTNLINKDWGRRYYISNNAFPLLDFEGFDTDGTTPTFSFDKPDGDIWSIDDAGFNSSRWQAQIGIRYIF